MQGLRCLPARADRWRHPAPWMPFGHGWFIAARQRHQRTRDQNETTSSRAITPEAGIGKPLESERSCKYVASTLNGCKHVAKIANALELPWKCQATTNIAKTRCLTPDLETMTKAAHGNMTSTQSRSINSRMRVISLSGH